MKIRIVFLLCMAGCSSLNQQQQDIFSQAYADCMAIRRAGQPVSARTRNSGPTDVDVCRVYARRMAKAI